MIVSLLSRGPGRSGRRSGWGSPKREGWWWQTSFLPISVSPGESAI